MLVYTWDWYVLVYTWEVICVGIHMGRVCVGIHIAGGCWNAYCTCPGIAQRNIYEYLEYNGSTLGGTCAYMYLHCHAYSITKEVNGNHTPMHISMRTPPFFGGRGWRCGRSSVAW